MSQTPRSRRRRRQGPERHRARKRPGPEVVKELGGILATPVPSHSGATFDASEGLPDLFAQAPYGELPIYFWDARQPFERIQVAWAEKIYALFTCHGTDV